MKKSIGFVLLLLISGLLSGCVANSYTGSITVTNTSDQDVNSIKVGNVFIGTLLKGQATTVYFSAAQDAAPISADGAEVISTILYDGTIDLRLNYVYTLSFYNNGTGDLVFNMNGSIVGGNTSVAMK
jgi:hypothetical protein